MIRLRTNLVLATLCVAGLVSISTATEPTALNTDDCDVDLLLLRGRRLERLGLRIAIEGQSVDSVCDEAVRKLFAFLDRNGDGKLSGEEAEKLPTSS